MGYNLIKKIRDHEFSLKEDFNQTMKDVGNLMHKMHPVYKKTGLDKLVKSSERILGPLDDESRAEVETGYAAGTIILGFGVGAGIGTGEPLYYIATGTAAGILYGLGLLHHFAMGNNKRGDKTGKPKYKITEKDKKKAQENFFYFKRKYGKPTTGPPWPLTNLKDR